MQTLYPRDPGADCVFADRSAGPFWEQPEAGVTAGVEGSFSRLRLDSIA
jgi:hypothetical protein